MNYNWTNNAYWLLRLRLMSGVWVEVSSVSIQGACQAACRCRAFSRTACRRLPAGRLLAEQEVKRADWWA